MNLQKSFEGNKGEEIETTVSQSQSNAVLILIVITNRCSVNHKVGLLVIRTLSLQRKHGGVFRTIIQSFFLPLLLSLPIYLRSAAVNRNKKYVEK